MATHSTSSKFIYINQILRDPDRKSVFRILYESISLLLIYKELPFHYFNRFLFKKGTDNFKNYLPNKFLGEKITPNFNDKKVKEVLDNKLFFDFFYRQVNIPVPTILMYNHNRMFVIGNRSVIVETLEAFTLLLEEIFTNNSFCDSIIIKKTCSSSGGANIYKLYKTQLLNDPQAINEIYCIVIKTEYLFQECIKQHSEMNKLNGSSLNSMRIDTFIDREGKIEIISGFIRMSINSAFVDNICSGGCFVGIDIETGKLKRQGYSMYSKNGPVILFEHPVTKRIFGNFTIPFFDEAKELVIKTASFTPSLRLVGWDVAISENGPVMIEGNSDYEIRRSDLTYGGYLANPVFRKVLHEINYL